MPDLPKQGTREEQMVRAWDDKRLASELDRVADNPRAYARQHKDAVIHEAARRLRWGGKNEPT